MSAVYVTAGLMENALSQAVHRRTTHMHMHPYYYYLRYFSSSSTVARMTEAHFAIRSWDHGHQQHLYSDGRTDLFGLVWFGLRR